MRQALTWSVLAMMLLFTLAGCKKGGGGGGDESVEWPEQPANGQPVVIQFDEMIGEGEDLGARMHVFNFSDQDVQALNMTLHYLNEAGEELDTFPFGVSAPKVVEANGQDTIEVGAFVPPETTRIEADLLNVTYDGGGSWSAE